MSRAHGLTFGAGLAAGLLLGALSAGESPTRAEPARVATAPARPAAEPAVRLEPAPTSAPVPEPRTITPTVAEDDLLEDDPATDEEVTETDEEPAETEPDVAALLAALGAAHSADDLAALEADFGTADPRVWAAVTELLRHAADPALRAGALTLIGVEGWDSAQAEALAALERERDPQVLLAAARVLEHGWERTLEEAHAIVPRLATLSVAGDAPLRATAVGALAVWYRSADDLAPVLGALAKDADLEVRAAAARALASTGCRDARVVAALTAAATRPGEDPSVRGEARLALDGLGPLPAAAREALAAAEADDFRRLDPEAAE